MNGKSSLPREWLNETRKTMVYFQRRMGFIAPRMSVLALVLGRQTSDWSSQYNHRPRFSLVNPGIGSTLGNRNVCSRWHPTNRDIKTRLVSAQLVYCDSSATERAWGS